MSYHLVTVGLLLLALLAYVAGAVVHGTALFFLGGALELWFWFRLLKRKRRDGGSSSD